MRGIEKPFVIRDEPGQLLGEHDVQLLDHLMLAGHHAVAFDEVTIQGRIVLPGRQAAVAPACFLGQMGVDTVQILQHLMNRVAQAVDVQATEFDARFRCALMIEAVQPIGKGLDLGIAPHPRGEAAEDMALPGRRRQPAHIAVDMPGIWPVGFDRHHVEAVLLDQALGNGGAGSIKIMGAMAGLADQDHPRIPIAIEQLTKGRRLQRRQRLGILAQDRGDGRCAQAPGGAITFIQPILRRCVHVHGPHGFASFLHPDPGESLRFINKACTALGEGVRTR